MSKLCGSENCDGNCATGAIEGEGVEPDCEKTVNSAESCKTDDCIEEPKKYEYSDSHVQENLEKAEPDCALYEKNCVLKEFTGNEMQIYRDVVIILNRLKFAPSFEVTVLAKLLTTGILSKNINQVCRVFFKEEAANCMFNASALEMRVRRAFNTAIVKSDFHEIFRRIFNMDLHESAAALSGFITSFVISYNVAYKDIGISFISVSSQF